MEAHKEMKEELEKGSKNVAKEDNNNRSKLDDQVTKRIIGEFIIPSGNNENGKAQVPQDVLAFSRSVNKVDSSLE
ncbi:hypothetical protein TanjilG_16715 [Lupinus angustifolius]|uniref:Uncharacterized protein n=1 Tax=Lupinus angustifolius TaxID=3871 RepID=A0A4P1QZJ0_LUPAN|nr:hypothetical protein TanjilG_16715 [Lupinus angustifolius]